jgi:hypothetical protein
MLGGGWRQAGVLAAAGLIALTDSAHTHSNLAKDHANAQRLAQAIGSLPGLVLSGTVETNVVYFLCTAMTAPEMVAALSERGVKICAFSDRQCRAACHLDVDTAAIQRTIVALTEVTGGARPPPATAKAVMSYTNSPHHDPRAGVSYKNPSATKQMIGSVVLAFAAGYLFSQSRLKTSS